MAAAPGPAGDSAVAADFVKRQLTLAWVSGLVALVVLAGSAVALAGSREAFVAAAAVGTVALLILLVVLLRHAVRVARFAFRREVHD